MDNNESSIGLNTAVKDHSSIHASWKNSKFEKNRKYFEFKKNIFFLNFQLALIFYSRKLAGTVEIFRDVGQARACIEI